MSALAFQNAVALLIRFPTQSLEALRTTMGDVELTAKEEGQLKKMAVDPLIRKFGYKMSYARQRDASKALRLSKDIMTPEVFDNVYRDLFEPSRTSFDLDTIGVEFIHFCLNSPLAQEKLAGEAPYLTDVFKYEYAKTVTELGLNPEKNIQLPQGSCLRRADFKILDLQYDIPAIDRVKIKDPESRPVPVLKPMKLIFMSIEEYPYSRMFQIDETIEKFLTIQRSEPLQWEEPLPKAYEGMVKVGLCRPLS